MPVTPFHFGPGAALKAIGGRHVSFLAFAAANVVIDLESGLHLARREFPVHTFLHTFLGSSLVILPVAAVTWLLLRRWRPAAGWAGWVPVLVGAAAGAWSHVVLDAIMHADVRPFAPLSEANPLLGAIGLDSLHLACLVAAVAGAVGCAWRWRARSPR